MVSHLGGRGAFRLQVTGLVQGVGFRPYVHRLAARYHLGGWVRNGSGSVQIAIEGAPGELEAFLASLRVEAPPLARIEALTLKPAAPEGLADFAILASATSPGGGLPVSPDVGLCAACEAELFDPTDRRYRYPFITCTDCGPRFTVIEAMPYDRERTSMVAFQLCPACQAEYEDPADRRHHSETNSCPVCGPRLLFRSAAGQWGGRPADALARAAELIRAGGILALRGLGGFQLAVDATNPSAVDRLRARKGREAKPLALMVRALADARTLAAVDEAEAVLLQSAARPIVLLALRPGAGLAAGVAPGLTRVGIMLAPTPLHHLLLEAAGQPLVMTSGNRSEEPIAIGNGEALIRLANIADGFLLHDREIVARYDDSVVRVVDGEPVQLRRARGYAPLPLPLPVPAARPLIALGPHFKNTITVAEGASAYVSQHIGELDSVEALEHCEEVRAAYQRLFRILPEVAVRDTHPGYVSSRLAAELGLDRTIAVQHHHAHIAAIMGEHGVTDPVIGVAFDGTGYGDDGSIWGAELLVAELTGYRRVAQLRPAPLPGGDKAARAPWRAALGYLSLEPALAPGFALAFQGVAPAERALAERQIARGLNAPAASSMGRLFDAAAAVIGLRRECSYEGQAAMELEALAGRRPAREYSSRLEERNGRLVFDPLPLLDTLGWRALRGDDRADLAADFHASIAWVTMEMVRRVADRTGLRTVALGGGVFQNARLLESLCGRLAADGFRALVPRALPPNDGAISYGQAVVAAALLAQEGAA